MPFTMGLDIFKDKKVVLHTLFSHNYARIKIHSNDFLPLEKTLLLQNVIALIKSFLSKS